MKRLLVLLLVPACTGGERANSGQCPEGEVCSALTPRGLQFIGDDLVDTLTLVGPSATAIGGTQAIALQYDRGDNLLIALDLPYEAKTSGNLGVTVQQTRGSVVTVQGAASGTNYLRIVDADDGTLFDRKLLGAGAVSIEASAGGQSATRVLPVGAMARTAPRPARELPTTAGERASM